MSTATSLSNCDREQNYRFQEVTRTGRVASVRPMRLLEDELTGRTGRPLTPAQNRRIRKHNNRAIGEVIRILKEKLEEQTSNEVPEIKKPSEVLSFPASDKPATRPCGGTDHCVTSSGKKARTHVKCRDFDEKAA